MVTTTTPRGQRVSICTCIRTGRHLAMFTRRPGSSPYTLTTEPPQVGVFAQVSASGMVATPCSCHLLWHQTLLWHHRLGHPSLPRLCGMHSRLLVSGLPRSLPPLPPSPALPYLPCIEGRQHATPHSSSFPPTSAPLQTLHMDVSGPARVSGQDRERYFLLVVDDYTRYTTVFPLRSKGEVPDVLIPWIRAVRLQLRERFRQDLPVLRLHFDRGGEFSSDLLREFCRGEGILQSFTLPTSPQRNGIAERRIGLVMDVARTSMIHAAAPHFLWLFTVQYAVHQLNLWPRSRTFVRDTSVDKLSSCTIRCVFLGFPSDASGWHFYHPTSRHVLPSQKVMFDESVPFYCLFPYRACPSGRPPHPQGPAPSGVSQVDPLPGTVPVEVAVDSGAARGAASGGVASGGAEQASAEPGGAEPGGAESLGAEPGGAKPGGAEPGGTDPEGAEPGGAESEGVESGGAEPRGAASAGGPAGARASPAGGTGAGGAGATIIGGAGVTAGAGGTGGTGAAGLGGALTRGTGAAGAGSVGDSGSGDPGAGGSGAGGAGACGTGARGTGGGDHGAGGTGAGGAGAGAGGSGGGGTGAGGAEASSPGGAGVTAGARGTRGAGAAGLGGAHTRSIGAARAGGVGDPGAGGTRAGDPGACGAGAGGAGAGGAGAGGAGARDPGAGGAGAGVGGLGAGGTVQRHPFFVPPQPSSLPPPDSVLRHVLSLPSSTGLPTSSLSPPPYQLQPQLQPDSPLPAPSPYVEQTDSFLERHEPESRPASPVCTGRRVPRSRPPPLLSTHVMALRPSLVPLRVPLPPPLASSLIAVPDPEFDLVSAASPTVTRLLTTVVTDPSFESTTASALVAKLVDFAATYRLDYTTSLIAKSEHEDFECLAAAVPHLVAMLLAPEGDPDAPNIPTPRSYAEAITGPYSSQWQSAMDAKMASWRSTGTYVDAVPPPGTNIVDGMWIFRVNRPPGSPPLFKARYVLRVFNQRQGVNFF
ncbi:unnamed protein product [Closterium sp. NIES-54]